MADINLTADDLPAIEDWNEDTNYRVTLTVRQTTPTEDGEARFEIVDASGRKANNKEREESEDDESSNDFRSSFENAMQDVMTPSNQTDSPEEAGRV